MSKDLIALVLLLVGLVGVPLLAVLVLRHELRDVDED